jgi:hypothetical protein
MIPGMLLAGILLLGSIFYMEFVVEKKPEPLPPDGPEGVLVGGSIFVSLAMIIVGLGCSV